MLNIDLKMVGEKKLLQLNELDELRLEAYESSKMYKERIERGHDKHLWKKIFEPVTQFQVTVISS